MPPMRASSPSPRPSSAEPSDSTQRLTQALDDQPFAQIDGRADKVEYQHHFDAAQQPGDQVVAARPYEPPRRGVERSDRPMQPGNLAQRRPCRSSLGEPDQAPLDQMEQAKALRRYEGGDDDNREADAADDPGGDPRLVQAGNKQRQAEQREDDLAQHLHGEIDGNACTARTKRHATLPQQPRADEFAADLRDRKKIVDRLSDPAKGDEGGQPGP